MFLAGGMNEWTCDLEDIPSFLVIPLPLSFSEECPHQVMTTFQSPELISSTVAGPGYFPGILSVLPMKEKWKEDQSIYFILSFTKHFKNKLLVKEN